MSELDITIEPAEPGRIFHPKETIAGRVNITSADGDWEAPHAVELVLFWKTSGIGTSDTGMGESLLLAPKGQRVPARFSRDFALPVPLFPYTYAGKLIKIDWMLAVEVSHGWRKVFTAQFPVEIRPSGAGVATIAPAPVGEGNPVGDGSPLDITYDDRGEPIMKNSY